MNQAQMDHRGQYMEAVSGPIIKFGVELFERLDRIENRQSQVDKGLAGLLMWVKETRDWMARADEQFSNMSDVLKDGTFIAERFVVRDKAGKVRAALSGEEKGPASLTFFDDEAKPLMSFDVTAEGAQTFGTSNPTTGEPTLAVATLPDGESGVVLYGNGTKGKGRTRVELTVQKDGTPRLSFFDRSGRHLMSSPVSECRDCGDEFLLDRGGVVRCPDCRVTRRVKGADSTQAKE